ncbi:hypothetical protein [Tessaracoccus sp. MC1756]|uniref:hypothetical protein n=1 Tax=Tessaracoccus sp. MC1756 TaxID=2760311 RepID=UPI0016048474|nr:hypothetical protein [Tessaracoccus sp. MC1756]MBB1510615.1 hypothetical protein [Tessaracoccus sp. MC1756]
MEGLQPFFAHPKTVPLLAITFWTFVVAIGTQLSIDWAHHNNRDASGWRHLWTLAAFAGVFAVNEMAFTSSYPGQTLSELSHVGSDTYWLIWIGTVVLFFALRHLIKSSWAPVKSRSTVR